MTTYLQPVIESLGIIVGALIVVWQLGRQHTNAISQLRDNLREQMRLEIYRDMASKLIGASGALSELHARCFSIVSGLRVRRQMLDEHGRDIGWSDWTHETLQELGSRTSARLLDVTWIMETYEIAFPGFQEVKSRLVQTSAALSTAFGDLYAKLSPYLTIFLPAEQAQALGQARIRPAPPTGAELDEIGGLNDRLSQIGFDMLGYLFDLRVAAQNHLLTGVFSGRVRERQPTDPRIEVLRPVIEYRARR